MSSDDLYSPPLVHPAYARAAARRIHSQDIWAAARQLYEAGASGPEVMERYGIGRSAFYQRVQNEGWRRLDPDSEPLQDEFDDPDADVPEANELAEEAWRAAARAVQRGRLAEARGWVRLHRELREARYYRPCATAAAPADSTPAAEAAPEVSELDLTDLTDSFSSAQAAPEPVQPDSTDLTDSFLSAAGPSAAAGGP